MKLKRSKHNFKRSGKGIFTNTLKGIGSLTGAVINKGVDLLPFEAHLPGYRYCGPGTKLAERLARGDRGINGLDEACKLHDIAYSKYSDTTHRAEADRKLAEQAWERFKANDSSLSEKAASWAVTTAMKAKSKLGGSHKRRKTFGKTKRVGRKRKSAGKGYYLNPWPPTGRGVRDHTIKKKKKRCCRKKKVSK